MKDQTELESKVQEWLEEIKPVPPRNPHAAVRGRAQFLGQAVSASEFPRHKGWSSIFRKERFAMNMIVSILVIAGLLLGGGATVNAAQNDLPNQPLYALKIWSEDLGLQFQNNPEQKVERLMDLTQARIQEMTRLTDNSQEIPDQLRQRLQDHIQQALQICATLDDPVMDQTLLQIRDRLQQHDRDLEQLQLHAVQNEQTILLQTRTMLQQRLHLANEGLLNHEMFRNTVHSGFQFGPEEAVTPPVQNQNGNGFQIDQPTMVPGGPNTNPGGPNTAPTGSSYGPGEPNTDPGGPNPDAGGPNMNATPRSPTGGSGTGGTGSGGSGSGNGGTGGSGTGSGGTGSGGTGTGGGGGGSGSGGQGGKP